MLPAELVPRRGKFRLGQLRGFILVNNQAFSYNRLAKGEDWE